MSDTPSTSPEKDLNGVREPDGSKAAGRYLVDPLSDTLAVNGTGNLEAALRPLEALIIDDEKNIRTTLAVFLEQMGCRVRSVATAAEALASVVAQRFDLAFLDLRLGSSNGLDLLSGLLSERSNLDVIVMTAYAAVDSAVEAMKRGASDYIAKPFTPAQLRPLIERTQNRRRLESRVFDLESQLADTVPEARLETESPKMRAAQELILRAAESDVPVLIRGESGTGKGVLARALHAASGRAGGPFVVIHCPTLSEELLAGELFGHARGAFTGAVRDQPGKVEAADGGSLFLDEIGELALPLQAKLLRFLQEKRFERLGETKTRVADVRIVCATNRDLQGAVEAGVFRLDLLYRLNVVEAVVPPLRERPEDLLILAQHFLTFFAQAAGRPVPELDKDAERSLKEYAWPGNVRELRNEMERAIVLSRGTLLDSRAFSERVSARVTTAPQVGASLTLEEIEKEHILRVLARTETQEEAARILGIDASTLWRKRKRYQEE